MPHGGELDFPFCQPIGRLEPASLCSDSHFPDMGSHTSLDLFRQKSPEIPFISGMLHANINTHGSFSHSGALTPMEFWRDWIDCEHSSAQDF